MIQNKQNYVGNKTEKDIGELLKKDKYCVFRLQNGTGGQPVDMVAIKGKSFMIFDVKHVESDKSNFTFSRIEPNQEQSLMYMRDYCEIDSERLGIVIVFDKNSSILWLSFNDYLSLKLNGYKSVNYLDTQHLKDFKKYREYLERK